MTSNNLYAIDNDSILTNFKEELIEYLPNNGNKSIIVEVWITSDTDFSKKQPSNIDELSPDLYGNNYLSVVYYIKCLDNTTKSEETVCSFKLSHFQGCCGIGILYNFNISYTYQGKRLSYIILKFAEKILSYQFSYALCTITEGMTKMKTVLQKSGWEEQDKFLNDNSKNNVIIYKKYLPK